MENESPAAVAAPRFLPSPGFTDWMTRNSLSLAFTARRANKLYFAGVNEKGGLSLFERTFDNASGLAVRGNTLLLGTDHQLWRLENALPSGKTQEGYDRVYAPRASHVTGDVAMHEIAVTGKGAPVFVNTRFSCLAALSDTYSFEPLWKPGFISQLAPEDRCHLNGIALDDSGVPAYATACSDSDTVEGWRKHRKNGGCLVDVQSGETVLSRLSMPHSPRLRQGRLWLLNSGKGALGWADMEKKKFVPLLTCPGYPRGLAFAGESAVVGVSRPRAADTFSGLPLDGVLAKTGTQPVCGLLVIDLTAGKIVHSLTVEGVVEEIMDVALLPGCRRPMAVGIKGPDIRRCYSLRPGPAPAS